MGRSAVILAAGKGTRMKSDLAKVLQPLAGRPMLHWVIDAVRAAGWPRIIVVVGHQADRVRASVAGMDDVICVEQAEQLGTGHAVMTAAEVIAGDEETLILPGDVPLLRPETLAAARLQGEHADAAALILTTTMPDPTGYGRILRDERGALVRIVEQADAAAEEAAVREVNTGVGVYRTPLLLAALRAIDRGNAQGEYYLGDVIPAFLRQGHPVATLAVADADETIGINDRVQLAHAEAIVRRRTLERLMREGVTILDPNTVYIDAGVEIGRDTVVHPFTIIRGRTRIGRACSLGPGAQIFDSVIGDRCRIGASVLESCHLAEDVEVGPYNHLRPETRLETGVKVGNFAELKRAHVGRGSKVPHHSYLGDARIGSGVNIGAGVVTVNYDGREKHETRIDDGAFVGCNVNLVAPLQIGAGAYIAAGSTLNRDVPPESLGIARSRQEVKEGWVRRRFAGRGEQRRD